jgi:hypothetical protein
MAWIALLLRASGLHGAFTQGFRNTAFANIIQTFLLLRFAAGFFHIDRTWSRSASYISSIGADYAQDIIILKSNAM